MIKSLDLMYEMRIEDYGRLNNRRYSECLIPIKFLTFTNERKLDVARLESISSLNKLSTFSYVERTLKVLFNIQRNDYVQSIVEKVLIWSEVAKVGLPHQRDEWNAKGYNLSVHNVGSAEIYSELSTDLPRERKLVKTLIETHGLIGQFIRGEINFNENLKLTNLITSDIVDKETLRDILLTLNQCILSGISLKLWKSLEEEFIIIVDCIVEGILPSIPSPIERIIKLRSSSIKQGEDTKEYDCYKEELSIKNMINVIFSSNSLWYVESALSEFSFEEFLKIFAIIFADTNVINFEHVSFEELMYNIYYDYKGKKTINVYKQRIIEKYLASISVEGILGGKKIEFEHISPVITKNNNVISFDFEFSEASSQLIRFCEVAEKSNLAMYEKSIVMLYDLFEFRRDSYDRFHNESSYLETMNSSIKNKEVILDYVVGKEIIDVGPGGGALLDKLEERFPNKNISGIDISENVITSLKNRKTLEGKSWNIIKGDILNLGKDIKPNSVDTIIFSSIIHELYSYIEFEGRKFNKKTIALALQNAFSSLKPNGRIIIRDGIMTDCDSGRFIRFKNSEGATFFNDYVREFRGRSIEYEWKSEDLVWVPNINDAMEFLYTYTWGRESYVHEVQEQFGYFTPTEYVNFIREELGSEAKVIESKHYLQEGYVKHLNDKIEFLDEGRDKVNLPDSTCLIVIQKNKVTAKED